MQQKAPDALIQSLCTRAILLQSGRIMVEGEVDEVIEAYRKLNQASP